MRSRHSFGSQYSHDAGVYYLQQRRAATARQGRPPAAAGPGLLPYGHAALASRPVPSAVGLPRYHPRAAMPSPQPLPAPPHRSDGARALVGATLGFLIGGACAGPGGALFGYLVGVLLARS